MHWIADAFAAGLVALDTETTSLDPMSCELVGVSLATAPGRACYIPLSIARAAIGDLFGGADLVAGQIPLGQRSRETEAAASRTTPSSRSRII